jgi:hypothetical protein
MNERVESADPEIVFQVRDSVDGNEIGQGDIHARHEDRGEGAEFYPKDRTGTDRVFNADFRDQAPIYPKSSPNVAMDSLRCLLLVSNLESHLFWCLALPNLCSRVFISR